MQDSTDEEPAGEDVTAETPVDPDAVTEVLPTAPNPDDVVTSVIPVARPPLAKAPKLPPPRTIPTTFPTPADGAMRVRSTDPAAPTRPSIPVQPPPATVVPPPSEPPRTPPPPAAKPQRVLPTEQPRKGGRGKLIGVLAALVLLAVAIAVALFLAQKNDNEVTPESQVTSAINRFSTALATGDLATLKLITCGELAEYYSQFTDQEFAAIHDSVDQDTFPTVARIDRIDVTGDTAIAEVTAQTRADPTANPGRSINLQKSPAGVWQVCYPPN